MTQTYEHHVAPAEAQTRLDAVLSAALPDLSRTRIQALIKDGHVTRNGKPITQPSFKVEDGDTLTLVLPDPAEAEPQAENIPLNVVYEDNHIIVINKTAGMVVHPGAGNQDGTLVNALLHHCKDSLSGIGGVLRPGIVHRLDKDTTGLMIAAKTDAAHQHLSEQLQDRSLSRIYHALVFGVPMPPMGKVEQALGRDRHNRLKMKTKTKGGKEAVTHYKTLQTFGTSLALMQCKLQTGRTHQIRVHMQALKHPILGDPLYGVQNNALESRFKNHAEGEILTKALLSLTRQMLHAHTISFIHPETEEEMTFSSDYPDDFEDILSVLTNIQND